MNRKLAGVLLLMIMGLLLFSQEIEPDDPAITGEIDETQLTFDIETQELEDQAPDVEIPTLGFGDFLRMILFLGLVIAIIYLFFWMLKRISGKSTPDQDIVNLLASQQLRNDQSVYLIEVGEQIFLLGGGSNQLSLITEITHKDTINELKLKASQEKKGSGNSFQQLLRGNSTGGGSLNLSFLSKQKERLKDL